MGGAPEASSGRNRYHLRRPIPGRGKLLNENARNTVNEIVPVRTSLKTRFEGRSIHVNTRTPFRVLLATVMTLALLPMLATFAPGGQVAGFTTAAPAAANKVWYQSVGRASNDAQCETSSTQDLATGVDAMVPFMGTMGE
jgi:hypothetical protein